MARMGNGCWRWILLWLFFLPLGTWAEDLTAPPEGSCREVPPLSETQKPGWRERLSDPERWENWHDRVSIGIVAATDRIDRFFGDERLEDDNDRTRVKLGMGLLYHNEDGASLVTDIKARLALSRLKNRFQLVIDDSFESDEPGSTGVFSEALKDSEPDTALRYIFHEKERRRLSADVGVRFSSPSQLFGRLRGRVIIPYGLWELRLTQTGGWFTDDGLVTTSEMRWTYHLDNSWLLRSSSRVTWEENSDGVTPAQSFSLFRELTQRRGYVFKVSGNWPETPHSHEAVYQAEFTYRQLVHSHWLFMEITPGVEFPQEFGYEVTPYIQLKFEVVFDEDTVDFGSNLDNGTNKR